MSQKIEEKLLKIAKAIIEYRDFFSNEKTYFKQDWKIELQKNSLKKTQIGVLINNFNLEKIMKKLMIIQVKKKYFLCLKKNINQKINSTLATKLIL